MKIVKRILQGIGIIIGIIVIYLLIVGFAPGFSVPKQRLGNTKQLTKEKDTKPSWSKKDVNFKVKNFCSRLFYEVQYAYRYVYMAII